MKRFLIPLLTAFALPTIAAEKLIYLECPQEYSYEGMEDEKKFKSIIDSKNPYKINEKEISSRWKKVRISDQEIYRFTISKDFKTTFLSKGGDILMPTSGFVGNSELLLLNEINPNIPNFFWYVSRKTGQFVFSDYDKEISFSGFCKKVYPYKDQMF